jgi:hypothetical protein
MPKLIFIYQHIEKKSLVGFQQLSMGEVNDQRKKESLCGWFDVVDIK